VRGDVTKKVRVFGLIKLFLKRFTVRSTTRTLITDKTDHSAFTAISGFNSVPSTAVPGNTTLTTLNLVHTSTSMYLSWRFLAITT
jgi:hypothetical protein